MGAALAFGSYIPGTSPLHRMNAQVKIILACAFLLAPFFTESWVGLGVLVALTACGYAVSRISLAHALRGLKPVAFILAFTVLAHAFTMQLDVAPAARAGAVGSLGLEGAVAFGGGNVGLSLDGLVCGCYFALRLSLLVAACGLLTFTSSAVELTDGLTRIMRPLRAVRVPVDDVATIVSMALRFIPVVTAEGAQIACAQKARCADFDTGGVLRRGKAWVPVLVPLMVRLFRKAAQLAQALDARCYRGEGRTHLRDARMGAADGALLVAGLAAIVVFCILL